MWQMYCFVITVCNTRGRNQGEGWSTENPKLFSCGTVCLSAGEGWGKRGRENEVNSSFKN